MKRECDKVSCTEEDLSNIEVKEYSKEELEENFSEVRGKRVALYITSTIFGILTFVFMAILIFVDDNTSKHVKICGVEICPIYIYIIAYAVYAVIFVCTAIKNTYVINMAKCKNYFEVEVLEKLPIESYVCTCVTSGAYMEYFHPIKVKDISNGYETILYIGEKGEKGYEKVDIGDCIKIPLKEDTVIRMMNRK